jgi:two-component system, cell cycle sensor histidine kinase and response regulator CckA
MELFMIEPQAKDASELSTLTSPLCVRKNKDGYMRYRALLEAVPDAIVVVDQSGTIVLVNAQAETLFGYGRDELIGRLAEILVSEHYRGYHYHQHSRFLAPSGDRPKVAGLELFGLRKDGSEFPAEIRLSPLDTKYGVLVSSAIRDLSERARTEEDLRRLASIVACSDDAIIGKTLEGIITSWNHGAERMYGYSAKEAIGKSVSMLVPVNRPDELPDVLERLKRGEIVDHFETLRARKDGKEFHIEITVSPIRDAMERVIGASTIGRDISERKRREEDQARLAAVVESSHDAILGRTLDGTVTHWNSGAQRIYGYSAAEIVGKSSSILLSTNGFPALLETLEIVKHGQIVEESDAIRTRQDGKEVHLTQIHAPIKNGAGEVVGVSTVARDITESRHLEGMLRQAQKMEAVGRLAGGVAHDFNNLLGVILGYTELLLDRLDPNDPQRHEIVEIRKAGDRAALLTRQLLAYSRKQVLQPKVLDLNVIVAGAEKLLHRLIGEDIELLVMLNPELHRVKTDPGQIEQIIMNLALNARDAMPAGGKLTIETSNVELDEKYAARHPSTVPGPHVMLAVTDTGCGMDAMTQIHVFEPFFTTKEFGKGTGLGLATVYGIVKQSGGSVSFYSELGLGTTFNIYLPCVDEVPQAESILDTVEKVDRRSQTILMVEDDAALLQVNRRSLEEVGYTILAAGTPAEAVHIAESHPGPIHLMVTDVILPGISGPRLASNLSPVRPEMKVLYVSGYTYDTIAQHGVLEPGVPFLQKPVSLKMLVSRVGEMLATPSLFESLRPTKNSDQAP